MIFAARGAFAAKKKDGRPSESDETLREPPGPRHRTSQGADLEGEADLPGTVPLTRTQTSASLHEKGALEVKWSDCNHPPTRARRSNPPTTGFPVVFPLTSSPTAGFPGGFLIRRLNDSWPSRRTAPW